MSGTTSRVALIAGASGLTGQALVRQIGESQASSSPQYSTAYALERRALSGVSGIADSGVRSLVVNFDSLTTLPNAQDAFCCLGTTIKKAGTQEAFRKVDFDYVLAFARAARDAGATQLLAVSALGASPASSIFYNRVKGEMEAAVSTLGFDAVHIFRPSFLLGDRPEMRLGEKIGKGAFDLFSPLMIGGLRKYRSIHVDVVARAMLRAARSQKSGVHVIESDEIAALGA
jgi:uncharacterized protein YbjT (DUF2867 family)